MHDDLTAGTGPPRHARGRLRVRAAASGVLLVLLTLVLSACEGVRSDPDDGSTRILGTRASVIVTRDGGRTLVAARSVPIERDDTALSVLEAVADVRLDPAGTIAQVNGIGAGSIGAFGPEIGAWRYRVDGIESNIRPEEMLLRPGQSVWWDYRRLDIYEELPVAVGVFPEPLFSGWRDADRPLRISYGRGFKEDAEFFRDSMFEEVEPDIVSLGGDEDTTLGIGGEKGIEDEGEVPDTTVAVRYDRANFIIARWDQVRYDPYVADAAFDTRGSGLTVWIEMTDVRRQDPDEERSVPLPEAEGLVWATTDDGQPDGAIIFLVTGITDEGVRAAARALRSGDCQFYLACAVTREGEVIRRRTF